jgi:hypothetical protein
MQKAFVIVLLPVVLILSACSTQGSSHVDPHASAASTAHATPAPKANPLLKGFDSVETYTDGVSVSVSSGAPYTPSPEAAGVIAGETNLVFTIVVTNGSKTNLDIAGFPQANSGGQAASDISDFGSNVGNDPMTTLLPSQTIKWQEAFSVADPTDITFMYAPSFAYDKAIFTSKLTKLANTN